MRQNKIRKDRRCSSCGQVLMMTAKQVKAHYVGCNTAATSYESSHLERATIMDNQILIMNALVQILRRQSDDDMAESMKSSQALG